MTSFVQADLNSLIFFQAKERSDDETDPIFVEDLEVDKVEKEEAKEEETKEKKAVDVDPRTKKLGEMKSIWEIVN